jgi:hypothetical protein
VNSTDALGLYDDGMLWVSSHSTQERATPPSSTIVPDSAYGLRGYTHTAGVLLGVAGRDDIGGGGEAWGHGLSVTGQRISNSYAGMQAMSDSVVAGAAYNVGYLDESGVAQMSPLYQATFDTAMMQLEIGDDTNLAELMVGMAVDDFVNHYDELGDRMAEGDLEAWGDAFYDAAELAASAASYGAARKALGRMFRLKCFKRAPKSRFNRNAVIEGFQDHHIVSNKNPLTKNHELLDLADFDLNSRTNRIFLPTDGSLHPTRSIHMGRHTTGVSRNLARKMDAVVEVGRAQGWSQQQYGNALRVIIMKEQQALKSGVRALNKNARPWAQ